MYERVVGGKGERGCAEEKRPASGPSILLMYPGAWARHTGTLGMNQHDKLPNCTIQR